MCTVVVRVDPGSAWPVTMLALRDESPERPWDPPAAWWPERDPGIRGVRDRSAGGAWLAASDRAGLAVVLAAWPSAAEWPAHLGRARALRPDWASRRVRGGAQRAAAIIEEVGA